MLVVFVLVVVVAGTFPVGPMTVDFDSAIGCAEATDVDVELVCTSETAGDTTQVHCELRDAEQVGRVVVLSAGEELVTDDDPLFEFTVDEADVEETRGRAELTVRFHDDPGELSRQYTGRLKSLD